MSELGDSKARAQKRWPVASIAAGLLAAAVLCQPDLAHAAHGGGGGFHGGGFGGFHGGGFHGGVANLHNGFGGGHGGHWYRGWHNGGYGWGWGDGLGWSYYPYDYGYGYPDYGYYNYSQPSASQTWYYCYDPAGYYPYVAQCNTGWQAVPAS